MQKDGDFLPARDVSQYIANKEAQAVMAIQRAVDKSLAETMPHMKKSETADYLLSPKYRLLPEEAPTEEQRMQSFSCTQLMEMFLTISGWGRQKSEEAGKIHLARPFGEMDVRTLFENYKYGELMEKGHHADITLENVLGAVKRELLYWYTKKETAAHKGEQAPEDEQEGKRAENLYQNYYKLYQAVSEALPQDPNTQGQ